MPTYEYHCDACGHITDFFCGFSERPNSILCEQCEAEAEYRISGGSKPIIKGGIHHDGAASDWDKSATIGEFWERRQLEIGGEKNKAANKKRLKKMRKKKND